jgi:alpha-glucosidase
MTRPESADVVLSSAVLQVMVFFDPWGIVVVDQAERVVLEEAPPAGNAGPGGPLGFQVGSDAPRRRWRTGPVRQPPEPENEEPPGTGGWCHATRLKSVTQDGDRLAAELETDDGAGRSLAFSVELVGPHTVVVGAEVVGDTADVEAISHGFAAQPGERFLGFGERSHAVGIGRGVIENYVGEGPFQPHEYPWLGDSIPPWGMRQRLDATYFPVPWVLSTAGYGLLLDSDEVSYARVRTESEDRWSVEVESSHLAYRLFYGPTPLEALSRFTDATGRQPEPERWFFGPWYQTGHANHVPAEEERRQLERLRAAGVPVSAAETHCRYLPLGEDQGHEAEEAARTAYFHSQGLATTSYLNPLVGVEYDQAFSRAAESGALQRRDDGEPYVFQAYVGGRTPPYTLEAQHDFTTGAGRDCLAEIAGRIVGAGHDGWMEDFGEYTPLDAVQDDGTTGTVAHNRYPTDYHAAAAEATAQLEARCGRRLARFVRSGWRGTAAVAPIVWSGDPTTSWGFDGLASAVICGLSMGASGVALWGSDTGGFFSTDQRLTTELLRRWIQFSSLTPLLRTKAGGIEIPPYERPQIWDDDMIGTWRRWAGLHTQLNDYLLAAFAEYRRTGRPIMSALELAHPGEPLCAGVEDAYLLGDDLLVAPVIEPECARRRVVLPPGEWIALWSAVRFDDSLRGLVMEGGGQGEVGTHTGPAEITVDIVPDEIPVYVRAGAVIGLLSPTVDTLSPYGDASQVVGVAEQDDRRCLLAFPGPSWHGALGPGLTARSAVTDRRWRLEIVSDRPRTFEISAWLGLAGQPSTVTVDSGEGVGDSWSYDGGTAVLRCTLSGSTVAVEAQLSP